MLFSFFCLSFTFMLNLPQKFSNVNKRQARRVSLNICVGATGALWVQTADSADKKIPPHCGRDTMARREKRELVITIFLRAPFQEVYISEKWNIREASTLLCWTNSYLSNTSLPDARITSLYANLTYVPRLAFYC